MKRSGRGQAAIQAEILILLSPIARLEFRKSSRKSRVFGSRLALLLYYITKIMQAGKRLADIAAPAVEVQPVEQPQVKKESAKQRARIEQGLAEVRVESIRVDGLVSVPLSLYWSRTRFRTELQDGVAPFLRVLLMGEGCPSCRRGKRGSSGQQM